MARRLTNHWSEGGNSYFLMRGLSLITLRPASLNSVVGQLLVSRKRRKLKRRFMIDARQKLRFTFFSVKLFAAFLFVLYASVFCQAQAVASKTCDFSEYKPTGLSHFIPGSIIEAAKPVYPPAARMVRAHGTVRVKILVDRRGRVRETCVLEGHPLLRAAAVQAARDTLFKPNFGVSRAFAKGRRFLADELAYNFTLE